MKRQFESKDQVGSCPDRENNKGPDGRISFFIVTDTKVADNIKYRKGESDQKKEIEKVDQRTD